MNTSEKFRQLSQQFIALFQRHAAPSPKLTSPIEQAVAQRLALSSMGLLLVILFPMVIFTQVIKAPLLIRGAAIAITLVVISVYFLSRTSYYKIGIHLLLWSFTFASPLLALGTPHLKHSTYTLLSAWNVTALILGALFLPRTSFFRLGILNIFALAIPPMAGKMNWTMYFYTAGTVVLMGTVLFGTAGATRRYALQMAESERRFRELFNSTLEALVIHDGVHILAVNPAFEKMFRCPAEQAIGRVPMEFVAPESRDHAWEAFLKNYDKPNTIVRATALRCDGSRFEAEASLGMVTYEGQQALALSVRDVSRRVKAEAELRKLSQAIEASAHAVVITNTEGVIEYVNPAFTRTTGYTAEEAIGQTPRLLKSGKNDPALYQQMWETIGRGEVWQGELINRRKDGSLYWESLTIAPVRSPEGKITHYVAIKEDISRRKRNEENLRKLAQAIEQSAHSVVITDKIGTIEYVNPAFTRVTGYTFEEAIGQNPRILKSGKHPRSFYQNLWNTILKGNVWHGEFVNRRKDGSLYWERASIAPVKNDEGKITHFVAVKEDITAYKELEAELRRARDEAEQASRLKTRLLGNVSHDMRTPLGGILGYTEMLMDGAFGEISSKQRHALERIFQSTHQLIEFTNDLLNQAELESGQIRLNITEFSPQSLLKVVPSIQTIAEHKGVQVHVEIDPGIPERITGDPYWLRQIIANLLSNAAKFTDEGHIWLRLKRVDDDHWAIEVEDTGPGIPAEAQERIFEAFQQADDGPTRHHKGTGLGLSIVKQLVTLMHGEIHLKSTVGKGSKFTVVLPCQAHIQEDSHDALDT